MEKRREHFKARVTGIKESDGLTPNIFLQDTACPLDFGPGGRITGIGPNFFLGHCVQGYAHRKKLGDYKNFGSNGLAEGVKVLVYHMPGDRDRITYVRSCKRSVG